MSEPSATVRVRPARADEVPSLVDVEIDAGRLFHEVGMPEVAGADVDPAPLAQAQAEGRVWVAVTPADEVAGYVTASVVDGHAHVDQVSVGLAHAHQGIGRRLVDEVSRWGREQGLDATTLTTFTDVPWNAPYYARLGFRPLADDEVGPELAQVLAHEAALPEIDPTRRVAMLRP
ncbi:MAG: GNAT family N-acetyltransferase [Nocardioides sp.]